jgi:WD40 repeat protein
MGGEVVLIDHHDRHEIARAPTRLNGDVLALSWCRASSHSRTFIAGTDQGNVYFLDMSDPRSVCLRPCPTFERLTSIHLNSTDQYYMTSGYSPDVSLFDLPEGRLARSIRGLHETHINVVKFSAENPFVFASSSFDKSLAMWDLRQSAAIWRNKSDNGTVMVIWSPDDRYILSSAVDNEVRQWLASDGRLDRRFDIQQKQSQANYTRAYYACGGDYIVTGSCEENCIRVLNSQTGKLLSEVTADPFDDVLSTSFLYIQSLRGDPFNPYELAGLVIFNGRVVTSVIAKTNLFGC